MANYKRGKCRYLGRCRRATTTFYRKRHGLRPIILPSWRNAPRYGSPEYFEWRRRWEAMRDIWWPNAFNMMGNWPRAWDILHHNRPRRAKEKMLARQVVKGVLDADNLSWPLSKKPHRYYW